MPGNKVADIPESFFEYRANLQAPLFEAWGLPNRTVSALFPTLKRWGVTLADVSWNHETKTFSDLHVIFNVALLRAVLKVALETVTFDAVNPDWTDAPRLIELFDDCLQALRKGLEVKVVSQEAILAFHVRTGGRPLQDLTSRLVNVVQLGPASSYGVSVYQEDASFVVDKSVRYEGGIFIRLQRSFSATVPFSELASAVYDDESRILRLLGLEELIGS